MSRINLRYPDGIAWLAQHRLNRGLDPDTAALDVAESDAAKLLGEISGRSPWRVGQDVVSYGLRLLHGEK